MEGSVTTEQSQMVPSNKLILNSPNQMRDANELKNNDVLDLLQVLYSRVNGRSESSWWSSRALRQVTFHKKAYVINSKLNAMMKLGIVTRIKVKDLPSKTVSYDSIHGVLKKFMRPEDKRRKQIVDLWCYKLLVNSIDLVFNPNGNRILKIPLESIPKLNQKRFGYLLVPRTFELLKILATEQREMDNSQLQKFLESENKKLISDDKGDSIDLSTKSRELSNLYTLSMEPFVHNITSKLSSNIEEEKQYSEFFIVKRTASISKRGKRAIHYSCNYDKISFVMTNFRGIEFESPEIELSFLYPPKENMIKSIDLSQSKNQLLCENITKQGIIVEVEK